ncbi:inactive peptidyl-prolyl cis-trans isomerase shutdown-like [Leptidea sinapis]|uniref:inactive peptidyl-prolyl cis-trans isomerase shutdown-like n=1 Tax=Leptidea sinapis TaxID=189913 RepID=UPI002132AAFF|nr:inactive peptidyl-prolyl cis-trans isomerase shutdown-like [Leptidea sinapis]
MGDAFDEPVQLSKGINLKDLLSGDSEFQIDLDFKKQQCDDLEDDGIIDDDDSDSDDVFKNIEEETSKMMLSCPEYHTFRSLESKMIDCVSSGDVKMLILEEGDGPLVPVDAEVLIHYAAYWEQATIPFDSTLTRNNGQPMKIKLGQGKILPGLEIGLTSIRGPKSRFLLLVQPALAWGPYGVLPRIKPEPALFVIALYSVNDTQAAVRFNDLPVAEQSKFENTTRTVNSLHTQAKDYFAKQKFNKCIKNYQQSMTVLNMSLPKDKNEENEIKRLRINTYVNLAVCYYKINKPKHVINMCQNLDYVTDINKHCKALFYYGRAYEMLGKTEDAIKYYKMAKRLEPKNHEIGKALADLDRYNKKSAATEKDLWQKAFKLEPQTKKKNYDVDADFQATVRDMCQNVADSEEYMKFNLPESFTPNEIGFIRDLCDEFEGLVLQENNVGKKKTFSIIKQGLVIG